MVNTNPGRIEWESTYCCLCGADSGRPVLSTVLGPEDDAREVSIIRCTGCGLVYLNPRPSPASISHFYRGNYGPHRAVPRPSGFAWALQRLAFRVDTSPARRTLSRPLRWFLNTLGTRPLLHGRPGDGLIDVGCASGRHLYLYHRLGWDVLGIESDQECCALIRRLLGLPVVEGSWVEAETKVEAYNAVIFWHVLEHIHDPRAALEKAFRSLAPGGLVQIAVPTCDGAGFPAFRECWAALEFPRHLFFFSESTLRRLLDQTSFTGIRIRPLWRESLVAWKRSAEKERAETGNGHGFFALVPPFRKGPDILLAEAVRPLS